MKNSRSPWRSFARLQEEERFWREQDPSYTKPRVNTYIPELKFDTQLYRVTDKSEYVDSIQEGKYLESLSVFLSKDTKINKPIHIKNYKQFLTVFGGYTKVRYSKRRGYRGIDKNGNRKYGL